MRASILVISLLSVARCLATDETFLDRFRYGIELMHRLFKSDAANNFRAFFAGAFNDDLKPADNFAENLFDAVIRTVGGNQDEIGLAGMRMSVFVAKMISDAFPQTMRSARSDSGDFSPFDTILRQPQVKDLITDIRDPTLTERVRKELGSGNDTECVRLLICKLSPFVRLMQRSLNFFAGADHGDKMEREEWAKSKPMERMYMFVPGLTEFLENGDICDERHPLCMY